jgi:hypothetical protein
MGQSCGGDGTANVCGTKPCVPTSCSAQGKNCGSISDGCGVTLNCGSCSGVNTCAGGGTANVCGCRPTSCSAQGKNCGNIPDGCGNMLNCGSTTCSGLNTCGGGGSANVCGCAASNAGAPCNGGCGTIQCNGSCSTNVANVGASCAGGCGTIQCSGQCNATAPGNLGAACNGGCGTIQCNSACSTNVANVGTSCAGGCGTIQCSGQCNASAPGNLGAACGCNGAGTIQCNGTCSVGLCADGEQCTAAGQCASGVCSTLYSDTDGDGYGNPGASSGICGGPRTGWVANASDCCDADRYVFPGQTLYFQIPSNCGGHDYDCSGLEEAIFWDADNDQPTSDPRPLRVYCDTATCQGFNYQCYWAGTFERCGDIYHYDIVVDNGCYFFGQQPTGIVLTCH